jgi:peptide/nickel transport system permease protein
LTLTVLAFNLLGDGLRDALERESGPLASAPRQSAPTPTPATSPAAQAAVPPTAQPELASAAALLSVRHLDVCFPRPQGSELQILHDVSFDLAPGETLGLVGESGSGKSMTALALLGLVPPPGHISGGSIRLNGRELVGMPAAQLRQVRGREIAMVFQEPMASLNPVHTVGHQLIEPLRLLHGLSYRQARSQAQELLALVQVPDPTQRLDSYPHQFSGGMAQRVMIARALACNQRLLVADEPTTALDVSVRGQILDLLSDIQRQFGMAILLITHDLGVVAEVCDRVAVMYAGQICETAPVTELFKAPRHPYTAALLATQPRLDASLVRLPVLEGTVPHPTRWPHGCRFHPRCAFAADVCRQGDPPLRMLEPFDVSDQSPVAYNGQVVASNQPARATRCVRVDDIALTIAQDE